MSGLIFDAMVFAMEKHKDQKRKFTGNPYFNHLAEVAGVAAAAEPESKVAIAVAWLHDVMEDQHVSANEIEKNFGWLVMSGVAALSDMESGNRNERKRLSRERLAKQPRWIQNIKVADIISNTSSVTLHDPDFAEVYLAEKRLMLDVLTRADAELLAIARKIIG
ncbi:HD domain-containing protein [Atlantibacter hermannii]|uniref:HD domain-containing protein n=1 Tax=Atlantibacter hermannii TaxID=565 RepID=UPI0032512FD4